MRQNGEIALLCMEDDLIGGMSLQPPLPIAEPRIKVLHDEVTIDGYAWLRDRENPRTAAYLEAENCFAEQATSHLTGLKATLAAEIEGRQPRNGAPPGFQVGSFEYFRVQEPGGSHSAWWRRPVNGGSAELVLDPNAIPGAEVFYALGVLQPSDDGRYVAFSFDLVGDERYELRVRDMVEGRDIWGDKRRAGRVVWAADNHTLFFTEERPDRRRHDRIVRLDVELGDADVIFEEPNEQLEVRVRRSDSGAWLFLDVLTTSDMSSRVQRVAAEVWCLPADKPRDKWRRIVARGLGYEVFTEHWDDTFVLRVNDAGPNWRVVRAPILDPSPSRWDEVLPHRSGVVVEEVHVLENHLILLEREHLRPRLVALNRNGAKVAVNPDEPSCTLTVGLSAGGQYSVARHPFIGPKLTYSVSSFVRPDTHIDHDFTEDRSTILYQAHIPKYEPAQYAFSVVMVEAEDGVKIPISLVTRRDRTSPGPVLLSVYGCYGISRWPSFFGFPSFMTARLSLLDRGVAFGIAHVRGGGEFGRSWHQAATRERKCITYTDLISAAEGLVERGVATRDGIVIEGSSGGGGVVLATAALRPDLFRAVVANVPLADIIDTEMDFTRPFALQETAEYGDPHIAEEYRYLRSYDPYYNLRSDHPLPPTYVDAALNDGQVLHYQPARYVAQRRSCFADRDRDLVFRIRAVGGHAGASHGADVAQEEAFRMAWVLDKVGYSSS